MILRFLLLTLSITGLFTPLFAQENNTIRVMSWNIRLDTKSDSVNQWAFRKDAFCNEVINQNPDVLGVQEALPGQMKDMRKRLRGYRSLGVARDDGKNSGEFSALFYKKKVLKPIKSGTFWLSETPDVPGSRGWDAACNRIVTWAEFKHKASGRHFMAFNTHFDHMGEVARVESAQLIIHKIAELGNKLPVILTGDFNVNSKHRAYHILTFSENEVVLVDSRVRAKQKTGPEISYISFDPKFETPDLIDFIFINDDFEVISHNIFDFRMRGSYLSDHLPIIVNLKIK